MDPPEIGQSTKRLRHGDRVSCRSRHFDPPGQPGAYSTGQAEFFYGVVTGGCASRFFQVHFDTDATPLRTKWDIMTLEKLGLMWEDPPPPLQQRPRETAARFDRRKQKELARLRARAIAAARPSRRASTQGRAPPLPPSPLPPGTFDPFTLEGAAVGVEWGRYTADPGVALALFHHATGLLAESTDGFEALAAPSRETLDNCVTRFARAVSVDVKRRGCAGCGVMTKEDDLKQLQIGEATLHLAREDPEFTGAYSRLSEEGKSAHHVKDINGTLFHVAPALLKEVASAGGSSAFTGGFCARCVARPDKSAPKRWRFVDRDYGVHYSTHHPSKARLSMLEEMAMARVLPFVVPVKLHSTNLMAASWAMRAHSFCVPHDGHTDLERQLRQRFEPAVGDVTAAGGGLIARGILNPGVPIALTYTFIGTGAAYKRLREKPDLIYGLAITKHLGAAFINYLAEAGHPDFVRFRGLIPDIGAFAPQLEAALEDMRGEILDGASVEEGQLIQTVESQMQAEGSGSSVISIEATAPADDRELFDFVTRATPLAAERKISVSALVRNELLNEYSENNELYQSAFPSLFPLGVPEEQRRPFPMRDWGPMLLGYQPGFERSVNFVGHSGDAAMRRARSLSASLAVKSTKKFAAFEALVGNEELFHSKVQDAVVNPEGAAAKELLKILKPVFCMANKHIPWSRGERKAEAERIGAVTRRFGPPSMMVTISPNATDEPLVVSLAARGDGEEWESRRTWEEKATHLQARRKLTEGAPASCAAFYDEFIKAVLACLVGADQGAAPPTGRAGPGRPRAPTSQPREKPITLIGRDKERVGEIPEGIFGRCRAAHGVTEAQGRGHLHAHILLWLLFGPLFMARFFHDDDKVAALTAHIDGLVTAQLARGARLNSKHQCKKDQPPPAPESESAAPQPGPGHRPAPSAPGNFDGEADADMVEGDNEAARGVDPAPAVGAEPAPATVGAEPTPAAGGAAWDPESPFPERPKSLVEAESMAPISGARFLMHQCCKRCRKPPKGYVQCAAAFSRPPQPDHTTVLESVLDDDAGLEPRRKKQKLQDRAIRHLDVISSPPSQQVPVGAPVSPLDERNLQLRLHRPYLEDCFTSETNKILQGCARHMNTNVSYVTGGQEANNLTHYMAKYTSKMANEATEFQPLIMKARQGARRESLMPAMLKLTSNAHTFPSSAADKDTSKRISQFFLTKVLNKGSGLSEFSAHQHAAYLSGHKSSFTSEKFVDCDVQTLARRAAAERPRRGGRAGARAPVASGPSADIDEASSDVDSDEASSDVDSDEGSSDNGGPDGGAAPEPAAGSGPGQGSGGGSAASTDFQRSGSVAMECKDGALLPRMDDYFYRDPLFYMYSYYEFVGAIQRKDKLEVDDGNGGTNFVVRGNDIDRAWEFQSAHPGAKTHYFVIRDRFRTPIFRGKWPAPPPLSHWKSGGAKKKAFISFYAFAFIPYWLPRLPPTMWPGGRVAGYQSADQYLEPGAFCALMKKWQASNLWLFRARYALYMNMVHIQHTPQIAKVISAKSRFEFVKPWRDWAEKDRPRPPGEAGEGAVAAPTETDVVDRMIAMASMSESLKTAGYKLLREDHRRHITATFHEVYPPMPGRRARDDEGASAGEDNSAAAVAARAPALASALKHRCEWGDWERPLPPSLPGASAPESAPAAAPPSPTPWQLHSLRGYMDDGSIFMCSSDNSWRVELHSDALSNDPQFPAAYPTCPSKLYLHSGFCRAAIQAGVDLPAKHTVANLLPRLKGALAATGVEMKTRLGEMLERGTSPGQVVDLALASALPSLESPGGPTTAAELEKLIATARSCHAFIRFLELTVTAPRQTPVVFCEGDRTLRSDLNPEQRAFYDRVIAGGKLHLLCGRAGTGKTYTVAAIQHRLELMGVRCAAVAFMWSAVFQMKVTCEKCSIHRLLGLGVKDLLPERIGKLLLNTRKLEALKERVKGLGALFVDEISTTAPELLYGLDKLLRLVLDPALPFGGLLVILLGDFAQLPPVKAASLAQLSVCWSRRNHASENRVQRAEHLVEDEAARLFVSFRKFDLTAAERCKDDPAWSEFTAGFDPALADPPISAEDLEQLKQMRLSARMIDNAPDLQFATVAAQTNFETKIINDLQTFRFAENLDDPVFRTVSGIQCAGGRSDQAAEGIRVGGKKTGECYG